jgi:hypothetical protein
LHTRVALHPGRGQPALHLLDLASDPDLSPLLDDHLGDQRERQESDVRGQGQPEAASAVGA